MAKDYDGFRSGMLRAAEMVRNEFKRAPEAAKGHDCVYMSGYEDACDHLSAVIAQVAVIDSVRPAGAQPDWQYHISLLLPEGVEDAALLKVYQVVEHETRVLTDEVTRLREALEWKPIAGATRDADSRNLIGALIDERGKIWRVSLIHWNRIGWYEMNSGHSCHWVTHFMPAPAAL
jgi:hypothetical protein